MFNGPGRRMPIEIRARRVTYGPRQYIICVGREVSRERGLAREVIRLRDPDLETGLPSADAFQAELDRCWNWAMNCRHWISNGIARRRLAGCAWRRWILAFCRP